MRRGTLIAVLFVLLLLAGGAAAGIAVLDHQAEGHIAKGVRIGGVDVGGMEPAAARTKLRHDLLDPLDAPVVVHYHGQRWKLSAEDAHIRADIGGMVHEAMDRSDQGSFVTRAWRELTGGKVDARIPFHVSYKRSAVHALVARIEGDVNRDPKDATLTYATTSLSPTPGEPGVALRAGKLERRIMRAIDDPTAPRRFRATTRTVEPEVTEEDLAQKYPVVLTVERSTFQLRLFKNLQLVKTYPVSVGMTGLDTPAGLYHIQNKAVDPAWIVPNSPWTGDLAGQVIPGGAPNNPLKARWMGIFDGAGIHGIDPSEYGSIGHAASHGCVRMRIPDVEELYPQVPVGAPIYIA
jgi:lipoprotein-anchoring transpeptidase ErfK/SrfK